MRRVVTSAVQFLHGEFTSVTKIRSYSPEKTPVATQNKSHRSNSQEVRWWVVWSSSCHSSGWLCWGTGSWLVVLPESWAVLGLHWCHLTTSDNLSTAFDSTEAQLLGAEEKAIMLSHPLLWTGGAWLARVLVFSMGPLEGSAKQNRWTKRFSNVPLCHTAKVHYLNFRCSHDPMRIVDQLFSDEASVYAIVPKANQSSKKGGIFMELAYWPTILVAHYSSRITQTIWRQNADWNDRTERIDLGLYFGI